MFTIDKTQREKLDIWQDEQDALWKEKYNDSGQAYYGACGGSLTYSFTPTTLGVVVKVKHANGNEIDLTDYDW